MRFYAYMEHKMSKWAIREYRRERALITIGIIAVAVGSLALANSLNAGSPSPTISLSTATPLRRGAPPIPTGEKLATLIEQLGQDSVNGEVVSIEIVPTTLARAEAVSRLASMGPDEKPVYIVLQHGSFSCLPQCAGPAMGKDLDLDTAYGSERIMIVDAATNHVMMAGGTERRSLSDLGPVTTVSNLSE